MKKLAAIAIAAAGGAVMAPQAASAQVFVHPGFHHGGFGTGNFFGGFAFGGFFHQPQFHVQNWQLYGFIAPQQHQRWVRYYDDAYLVDRRGYIFDRRQRVNWDGYGERWGYDQHGIPHYVGRGDYHPDDRDYAEVEDERRYSSGWDYSAYNRRCGNAQSCNGYGYGNGGSYGHSGQVQYRQRYVSPPLPLPPSCGRPEYICDSGHGGYATAYGHGYGHGYGYGGGTVIVTETTVTPGTVVTEEIVEEVVEERAVRRHRPVHRAKPHVRRHAPPPRVIHPRGDRG